jgi:ParB-like chromosome segregation protein Spo0J
MTEKVQIGFEAQAINVGLEKLLPTRSVQPEVRKTRKFAQILSSIREIGLIEPLIVTPADPASGLHMLLDGHLRLLAMRDLGLATATCLLSRDDEGYTYNKRVNRLATVQEHYMVLRALERGVPEDRLAKALDINIASLRRKRDLLDGICPEVEDMLKDRNFSADIMRHLRKMKPQRQIECADLMCSMNNFSVNYAGALLAATTSDQLLEPSQTKGLKGLSSAEIARMEQEMSLVQNRFKVIEQSYSNDVLNMVLARGFLNKLVSNKAVASYLQRRQPDLLEEFRSIVKIASLEEETEVQQVA